MDNYVLNPLTNRMVKVGSQTYRKLVNSKVIKNKAVDERVIYKYDSDDDIEELKKKYQDELDENEIIQKGKGRYKGKLIKTYKGSKGRPKKQQATRDDDINDLISSMLIKDDDNSSEEEYETDEESE